MIENANFNIPFCEVEDTNVDDFISLLDLSGEFLVVKEFDSPFYFICSNEFDIDAFCKELDWYIVSKGQFNDRLRIGVGISDQHNLSGEVYRAPDETTLDLWRDIINFTFNGRFVPEFFPLTDYFKPPFRLEGDLCYYIHDYIPVSRNAKLSKGQKKISNLIFRWKDGKASVLIAKIFSVAIMEMAFYKQAQNPIIIPIPASTQKRHTARFASFCSRLSKYLNVEDGFRAIWIREDREQLKGTSGQDKIANLDFNRKYIKDKDIFLIDDILTSGESYLQIKRKLYELGARSVVGLFLGKTVRE